MFREDVQEVVWEGTFTCCSVFLFSLVAKLIRKCGPREVDRGKAAEKGKLLPQKRGGAGSGQIVA